MEYDEDEEEEVEHRKAGASASAEGREEATKKKRARPILTRRPGRSGRRARRNQDGEGAVRRAGDLRRFFCGRWGGAAAS